MGYMLGISLRTCINCRTFQPCAHSHVCNGDSTKPAPTRGCHRQLGVKIEVKLFIRWAIVGKFFFSNHEWFEKMQIFTTFLTKLLSAECHMGWAHVEFKLILQ